MTTTATESARPIRPALALRNANAASPYQTASSPSTKYRMNRAAKIPIVNCHTGISATPAIRTKILNGIGGGSSAGT